MTHGRLPLCWSGIPTPGALPNPGIEPRSPTLWVDSLPSEPPGKPKNTEWVAYSFFSQSSRLRNWNGVSCIAGRFFTCWATSKVPSKEQLREKTLMLGKTEGKRRREQQRMRWLDSITDSKDMNLSKPWEIVKDRVAWHAVVHGGAKS